MINGWRRAPVLGVCVIGVASALWVPHPARTAEIIHFVQPGENLHRISLKYGLDWRTLMAANSLVSTNTYAGQTLIIPGTHAVAAPSPKPAVPHETATDQSAEVGTSRQALLNS